MSASGDILSSTPLPLVTELAMTALTANPTLVPIWAKVLKTPPAKPCVFAGKTDVITRFEIVKSVSAPMGVRIVTRNAMYQYGQDLSISAISNGLRLVKPTVREISRFAETDGTSSPVTMFVTVPEKTIGKNRRLVWMADSPCTSWKNNVMKYCIA